jgi:hypothetical protein
MNRQICKDYSESEMLKEFFKIGTGPNLIIQEEAVLRPIESKNSSFRLWL